MFNYPSNIYDQSAVIPYKYENNRLKILLIKSRKGNWIIPKGIIEKELAAHESARKEAVEEAGVDGVVNQFLLGEYKYEKWGGVCNVKVFPMLVEKELDKWEEDFFRTRKWFTFDKAIEKIGNSDLKKILGQLLNYFSNQKNISDSNQDSELSL